MRIEPSTFRRLCRARDLLCDPGDEHPTVRDIARAVAISPFHFIRQFEAVFGATPHQLRIQSRLHRAKRLLALGQLSVTDVCMELGFSSLGSFSDAFARRVGARPSAYRRRLRAMVQVPEQLTRAIAPGCLCLMGQLPPAAFARPAPLASSASGG